MQQQVIRVERGADMWRVREDGKARVIRWFDTKPAAVKFAKGLWEFGTSKPALVIHGSNGAEQTTRQPRK